MTFTDPYALLTRAEAAEHLRVTKNYVSELTRSGRLHSVRMGKRVLVPRCSLERFIRGEAATETDNQWPPTPSMFSADAPNRAE